MSDPVRTVVLHGTRDVRLEDRARPTPGPGEVLLRVEAAMTCGTDAKVYRRGGHARMLTPPSPIGHEYTGIVEEVGDGVTAFAVGDAVVGANSAPCGDCDYCAADREALCDDLLFVNGAFADVFLLPARIVAKNLYHRPSGLDPIAAASTEPVACVLKAIDMVQRAAPIPAGGRALLLGSGPIALVFAQELAAQGVTPTVVVRSDAAAETAVRSGVPPSAVIRADSVSADLAAIRGDVGFDLVVEAAGAQETSTAAPALAKKGGTVLLFGGCAADARVQWSPALLHYDEVQVLSSFHHAPRYVEAALAALASGRIRVDAFCEAPVGLDGVRAALDAMCARTLRGKVPVIPGEPVTRGGVA